MKFGIFYEQQLPKPWDAGDEAQLFHEALEQVVLADRLGYRLRLGGGAPLPRGILALLGPGGVPGGRRGAHQAHPARPRHPPGDPQLQSSRAHRRGPGHARHHLERPASDFGIGEGATRLELGGFGIPAKEKRAHGARGRRADRQHDGDGRPTPASRARSLLDALPQRRAEAGAEAASADVDGLHQPRHHQGRGAASAWARWPSPSSTRRRRSTWAEIYYDIIKSRRVRAARPQRERQHRHGVGLLAARRPRRGDPARPGGLRVLRLCGQRAGGARRRTRAARACWTTSRRRAASGDEEIDRGGDRGRRAHPASAASARRTTSATTCRAFQAAGVDQVIFLQQAGRNRHEHICESLELLAREVMPEFAPEAAERERRKAEELAPYIEEALARKKRMPPLADSDIPVVPAAVAKPIVNQSKAS